MQRLRVLCINNGIIIYSQHWQEVLLDKTVIINNCQNLPQLSEKPVFIRGSSEGGMWGDTSLTPLLQEGSVKIFRNGKTATV